MVPKSFFNAENEARVKVSAGWIKINIFIEKEIQF